MTTPIAGKLYAVLKAAALPVTGVSIGRADDKSTWLLTWEAGPTAAQLLSAASIIAALTPADYAGTMCWDAADVDVRTMELINAALAPGKTRPQQEIEREKTLTELTALLIKEKVMGQLSGQEQAALAAGLAMWANVIAPIRAAGNQFKAEHGWGEPPSIPEKAAPAAPELAHPPS